LLAYSKMVEKEIEEKESWPKDEKDDEKEKTIIIPDDDVY
jgi:hypothetical protein